MKKTHLAIDLGTTNTVVARWNERIDGPEIIRIDSICRNKTRAREIDDSFTIPSCVYLRSPREVLSFPFKYLFSRWKGKTGGYIGMKAIEKNGGTYRSHYVTNFKSHLGKNSYQFIGKLGKWSYTAEDITRIFLNQLFEEVKVNTGSKPVEATFCVPVDFYELYRAKLQRISSRLKINKIRTIDEPVAAALGYGLSLEDLKNILVIDFGAGTLDIALIQTEERISEQGKCRVVAKEGVPMGGNIIDAWMVEDLCEQYSYNFERLSTDSQIKWWFRMLLDEACRIKENLFFNERETFFLMPSNLLEAYARKIPGNRNELKKPVDFSRDELVGLLEKRGLYTVLDNLISRVMKFSRQRGVDEDGIDEVLMVGGSTLLPNIYSQVEKRFGRDRVRAWQPFNAVAFGAAVFAANRFNKTDYITHDYAFITYNKKSLEQEHNIIIPRGTVYPTPADFWKRQLSPTCALGEPENIFKLVVSEIGKRHAFDQEFVWDEKGDLHLMDDTKKDLIIPLNETDPTLGYLNPPHYPSDKRARVEISFMVNEDKWLCTTVYDLKTNKQLLVDKPVIRLK